MKITVRINEFKRVLEESRYVIGKKEEYPALEFVKIDVQANRATISASDIKSSIVQEIEVVDGDAAGSLLLHAKKTADFLKGHVDGTATIETTPDSKNTIVKAGAFTTQVPTQPV